MPSRIHRLGPFGRRAFLLTVLAAAVGGIVLVAGARERSGPAVLDLVVLGEDGRFAREATFSSDWVGGHGPDGAPWIPLILGIRNVGAAAERPGVLELAAPARFHLEGLVAAGADARHRRGEALVHYRLEAPFPTIEPGRLPALLPAADTVWLVPALRDWECVLVSDSVPELVPARTASVASMADLHLFYAFSGGTLRERQTGLLTIRMDSAIFRVEAPSPPTAGPIELRRGGFAIPDTLFAASIGAHRVPCGQPEASISLVVAGWRTPGGGLALSLGYEDAPRKLLLDMDGDGVVDVEYWDASGDGRFEARRETRLPIPAFLLPPARLAAGDGVRPDGPAPGAGDPGPGSPGETEEEAAATEGRPADGPAGRRPTRQLLGEPIDTVPPPPARDTVQVPPPGAALP